MTTSTKTEPIDDAIYIAWMSFTCAHGTVQRGEKLRGYDPIVQAAPHNFVPFGTPEREMPTEFDQTLATQEAVQRQRDAERRAAELAEAKRNPVKLKPTLWKLKEDTVAFPNGRPTMILRGSIVVDGDGLLLDQPDRFERA